MRVPVIAGNWKMNTTISEAIELVRAIRQGLDDSVNVEKIVCPPFISLSEVKKVIEGSSIRLGAQNLYFEEKGAYTGEISPLMLAGLCEYVIIGHSERRQYFNETGEIVNKKLRAALKAGLKPILCVGEKLEENEAGQTEAVVTSQLSSSLSGIDYPSDLVVAYEPIWAIGTGKAATGKQSNETIAIIRSHLAKLSGQTLAQSVRILYGGSVTADNIAEFIRQPEIDGALVGGASLKADQYLSM
ncbi:MAG: triose-phosphate isomerase, partial [Dehalococcoidales bacterium]|nr:triose-phosphate isomerase [Dehalococcoidales bacterium]